MSRRPLPSLLTLDLYWRIVSLVLTHWHIDHILGLSFPSLPFLSCIHDFAFVSLFFFSCFQSWIQSNRILLSVRLLECTCGPCFCFDSRVEDERQIWKQTRIETSRAYLDQSGPDEDAKKFIILRRRRDRYIFIGFVLHLWELLRHLFDLPPPRERGSSGPYIAY